MQETTITLSTSSADLDFRVKYYHDGAQAHIHEIKLILDNIYDVDLPCKWVNDNMKYIKETVEDEIEAQEAREELNKEARRPA
jgi:hypothetical protein